MSGLTKDQAHRVNERIWLAQDASRQARAEGREEDQSYWYGQAHGMHSVIIDLGFAEVVRVPDWYREKWGEP